MCQSASYYNHRRRKQFHFGGAERNIHRDHCDLHCNMNINKVSRVKYAPPGSYAKLLRQLKEDLISSIRLQLTTHLHCCHGSKPTNRKRPHNSLPVWYCLYSKYWNCLCNCLSPLPLILSPPLSLSPLIYQYCARINIILFM